MARIVNFFDGAQSETTPTIGNIVASSLVQYTDDADYEANEQGSPAEGNVYFNTTLNLIRYYNGSTWISLVDETSAQTLENKEVDGSSTGNNTVLTVADNVEVTPAGNLASTNTQDALEELQGDINGLDSRLDTAEANIIDLQTDKENKSEKGAANGYAPLDGSSLIPSIHLPSYVDDVLEYANFAAFPVTGETGKIYIDLATNKQWRWTGTIYADITGGDVDSVNGQTGVVVLDLDDINDVVAPAPSNGDVLTFNGTNWVNQPVGSSLDLTDLSDVDTAGALSNQYLKYDGAEWKPASQFNKFASVSSSPYNVQTSDDIVLVDSTSGDITINFQTAVGREGKIVKVVKTVLASTVTIDGNGSETVGGSLTQILYFKDDTMTFISDNANWILIEKELTPFVVRAFISGSQSIANGANNKIQLDGTSYDPKGLFDNANDRINITRPGIYRVSALTNMASTSATGRHIARIYTSSDSTVQFVCSISSNATGGASGYLMGILEFVAANNVSLFIENNTGATNNAGGGGGSTYLQVEEIL